MLRFPNYAVDKFVLIGNDLHAQSKNHRMNGNISISSVNFEFLKQLVRVIESTSNTTYVSGTPRIVKTELLLLMVERITRLPQNQQERAAMTIAKCIDIFSNFEKCIVNKLSSHTLGVALHALDIEFNVWILQILTIPERSLTKQTILNQIVAKLSSIFPDAANDATRQVFQTCENEQLQLQLQPRLTSRSRSSSSRTSSNHDEIQVIVDTQPAFYINVRNQFFFLCRECHIKLSTAISWSISILRIISDMVCDNKDEIEAVLDILTLLHNISRRDTKYLVALIKFMCHWKKSKSLWPSFIHIMGFIQSNIAYHNDRNKEREQQEKRETMRVARETLAIMDLDDPQQKVKIQKLQGVKVCKREPEHTGHEQGKGKGEGKAEGKAEGKGEGKGEEEKKKEEKIPDKKSQFPSRHSDVLAKSGRKFENKALQIAYDYIEEGCVKIGIIDPTEKALIIASAIGMYQSIQIDGIDSLKTRLRRFIRCEIAGERALPGPTPKESVTDKFMKLRPRINRLNFAGSFVMVASILSGKLLLNLSNPVEEMPVVGEMAVIREESSGNSESSGSSGRRKRGERGERDDENY